MAVLVILEMRPHRDTAGARDLLLQRYGLDYTDILQLTFAHWETLDIEDREVVCAALEQPLNRRLRRNDRHTDLMEAVDALYSSIYQSYEYLAWVLTPIITAPRFRNYDPQLSLVGWRDRCPVIQIGPLHETI